MNFTTILFDFDGTLTPSLELWLQAFDYAMQSYNLSLSEATIISRCFNRKYEDVAQEFNLESGPELSRRVQLGLELAYVNATLFPLIPQILRGCQQAGLELGLVTSSFRSMVTTALARFKITDYFKTIVSGDDVVHHKPHPEPVQLALERLNRKPQETLFVGDNSVDVLAGKAAGTSTALFLPAQHSRFYDFEVLRASQPDFVFSDYLELFEHLQLTV